MKAPTDAAIQQLLTHQVADVIDRASLEKKLRSGEKLRIKLGADPSRPDLHIGHAVVLRKLRAFQDLGHTVIFLIGDFTAKIGVPTGKSKTRPMLSDKEIKENAKTYLKQVGKILDVKKGEIRYNSEWLGKMKAADFVSLCAQFTVARIIER
ncbi:MAG TPA: tyrosine--tRNA ligase, partial [Candidatus Baltobacteraceae bacterium]|nr:tyrosine--tRNA ligase [Candidatus Baltobacteraceae bacterium]